MQALHTHNDGLYQRACNKFFMALRQGHTSRQYSNLTIFFVEIEYKRNDYDWIECERAREIDLINSCRTSVLCHAQFPSARFNI